MSGIVALVYLFVLLIYLVPVIRYRKVLLKVQYAILVGLLAGLGESLAWFFYRLELNDKGYYHLWSLFVVVFVASLRRTFTYLLVLLLSMGIGIIKWTLGTTRIKLGLLTILYLCFSCLFQFLLEYEALHKTSFLQGKWKRLGIAVPIACFSFAFYYWIALSLIRTIQQLTLRQQPLKRFMFKMFFVILFVTAVMSFGLAVFQAYATSNSVGRFQDWRTTWLYELCWELLFCFVLFSVTFLWWPRSNNTRYSYAEYFTDDDGGDGRQVVQLETLTVVGGGDLNQRRVAAVNESTTSVTAGGGGGGSGGSGGPPQGPISFDFSEANLNQSINASFFNVSGFERDILAINFSSDDSEEMGIHTQISKLD
eukprot:TRINITY_DN4233_c1_g1_i2.p1 TRINITY_DN4233_c1_g1~~TRINITY_DN4233_c1_g1_i2.p1  ORF type:complete len:367 (-),score=77.06 TRINITY_DN4233_c1_g1_i2:98-1198(-)